MIGIFDSGTESCRERLERLRPKSGGPSPEFAGSVQKIIADVEQRGDEALLEYAQKFDRVAKGEPVEVTKAEMQAAVSKTDPAVVKALRLARERIETYHLKQVSRGYVVKDKYGSRLELRVEPVARAGVYVPGGKAAYPSTVLMNVVPARVAGVKEIIATSPGASLAANPVVLAACAIAGVDRLFRFGGAQAIAALAFGTATVPKCPVIVGPGNAFVAEAKRQLYGRVGIDSIAGPSEVVVIADGTANPVEIAADLLSQAEHDELAAGVLITDSRKLAQLVQKEIIRAVDVSERRAILEKSVPERGLIIVVDSLAEAVEITNELAPEHVEVMVHRPEGLARHIRNAGAIFLGRTTPEAMGDYLAGSNHVLPTGGAASFSGPLGVATFMKKTSVVFTPERAMQALGPSIVTLAKSEGLFEHARSVEVRLNPPKPPKPPEATEPAATTRTGNVFKMRTRLRKAGGSKKGALAPVVKLRPGSGRKPGGPKGGKKK